MILSYSKVLAVEDCTMKVFQTLEEFPYKSAIQFITIGNFDGIHLGHQKVIRTVVEEAKKNQALASLITFINHPLEVLTPGKEILRICTPFQKERLISALGIDNLFNITFTQEFSTQDPETFLSRLLTEIGLVKLILGYDARIGKGREGDRERIEEFSKQANFKVEYVPPFSLEKLPVSSSRVRHSIQAGEFEQTKKLLGRPYSILSHVIRGSQKGREFGVRTANFNVQGLILPPYGIYLAKVEFLGKFHWGIASLGIAPTLQRKETPLLEVHLFNFDKEIYGAEMEVFLLEYLRPEFKFDSVDALVKQIRQDIVQAKSLVSKWE